VDPRQQHEDAVNLALGDAEAFQLLIGTAREKGDETVMSIARAVGSSNMESAANALNTAADIRDRLAELYGKVEVVAQELRRYGSGF
jgi:hypothetical protein